LDTLPDPIRPVPVTVDSAGMRTDSLSPVRKTEQRVVLSPDAFEEEVEWGATDTMWFDKANNTIHLYGSAYINYQSLKLNAGYIAFDFNLNEAMASPTLDSMGKESQLPQFEDGSQSIRARKIRYNLSSHKAKIYHAITKEGDLFVHGSETKYIGREADTLNHVETIYTVDGVITSCDADHPHFGIRARKLKIVPNKLAVLGFSMLEIAEIPTPLVLPFAFYPMFRNQRSGLILPNDYVFNERLGYGFNGIGLYFPISEYYDLKITGDIYTRGSWGLNLSSNYKKRYKYSGSVSMSYFNARTEQAGELEKISSHQFSFRLSHNQDSKAHPYQRFGGSVSFSLNGYDQTFNTDAATRLNNITRSNLNYSNDLPGTIFSVTSGFEHSQNTSSGKISFTFPVARLNMQTYFPFKAQKRTGKEKWYEKISIRYNADAKNMIDATDSTLFTRQTLENARYGLKHSASSSANFTAFKYFTLTPSVNYDETYFFKERKVSFDPTTRYDTTGFDVDNNPLIDTIYGQVLLDTVNTFKPFRNFNSSISMSTKQYGKILFSRGWLRGLRHVISYNVGFNYSPNTKQFYEVEIDADNREDYELIERYNIFVQGPYGQGNPGIEQMAIRYNISNNVEAKYFSRRDSTMKKFSLIRSFKISGNYNFAADSLKFSTISLNGSTDLFKNLVSIRYTGVLDPYTEVDNRRINTFYWETNKRPVRHVRSTLDINTSLTIRQIAELFGKKNEKESNTGDGFMAKESSFMDLFGSFRIKYDFGLNYQQIDGRDTLFIDRHVISTQGSIKLTQNWNMRIGHIGYDLLGKSITYPDLGFERNLHCWTMNFSWRPRAGQYTFFIGARSTTFEFLKYQHGQSPLETSLPSF
jgi:hypothetical protein